MPPIERKHYARPEALVSTAWVKNHLADPKLRLLEVNEDCLPEVAHIHGAQPLNWRRDLWGTRRRDLITPEQFTALMSRLSVANDTTVLLYGDRLNAWAAFALWVLSYHGHQHLKLMDGGIRKWEQEYRPSHFDRASYPRSSYQAAPTNPQQRAFKKDVLEHLNRIRQGEAVLLDVRSQFEYEGGRTVLPDALEADVLWGGHIPEAINVPWESALHSDRTFKSAAELETLYEEAGVTPDKDIIVYCRIGERACHTWFALRYLLGYESVRVYDGSWLEWSNSIGADIAQGVPHTPNWKA